MLDYKNNGNFRRTRIQFTLFPLNTLISFFLFISVFPLAGQESLIDSLNQMAYQRYRENVDEGKVLAYRALQLAQKQQLDQQIVDSYINLSRCFRVESKWDSAYPALDQAIAIASSNQYTKGLMNATNNMAACYLTQGDIDQAEPYLKQSLQHAQKIQDAKGQANAYNNLAIIAEARSAYETAIDYLSGALEVYLQLNDSSGIAQIYTNQAFLFDDLQKNDSAILYCFKALRIQESLGLVSQQAQIHNQIGELYFEKANEEEALSHYQSALRLYQKIGDISGLAYINNNIGSVLENMNLPEKALTYIEEGVELAYKTNDPIIIGSSLVNLAGLYKKINTKDKRIESTYQKSIPYLEETDSSALSKAYDGIGRFYLERGQFNKAEEWLEKALVVAEKSGDLKSQKFILNNLFELNQKLGKTNQAIQFLIRNQVVKDSLINLESLKTINKLNIEYESEKKEKENLKLENKLTKAELVNAEQKALRNQILGIASFILLLGLGGFIYYRYRQRIRIKEQEIELEQERLRKEQQEKEAAKLRELDAMKTRFFTNISHEFRTPLTLILGQNDQIRQETENQKIQNRVDMVGRNGHRLLDLVNQVLDIAKLEAGGMDLEMARIDAIPFLKHMLYSFESMGQEKGVTLVFESKLNRLETAFDHKKIERVIFNLLSNAMKFTPKDGEIRMEVSQQNEKLTIIIKDSGVGIKASQLPYIFDRFYQADSSENQPQPGTGIGLSLVKELIELHQGTIEVESEINKGTTFFIHLPIPESLHEYSSGAIENQLSIEALPSKELADNQIPLEAPSKREQILLIEDNPDIRAFVKEQILSFGYQVHEAADGVEGLEKAQALIPDLIISDIMMPRLDGYGVAKGLKEDQRTSHIPVVLLTSKSSDESKIAGLELGIDDYLLKPFNARELEIRISNLIEQRKRLGERFTSATVIRPNEVTAVSMDQEFLKKVLDCIEENIGNEQFGVEDIADHVGMGVNNLNRKLGALVDQTAGKLIRSMRLQRAADLLKQKAGTIAEIAYDTGFNSHASFNRSFKKQFGVSPTAYLKSV
jgi:signal transduction histidine kinase/DNA-binding response OmpR family regulator/Tfp pilus assembly protein PilF